MPFFKKKFDPLVIIKEKAYITFFVYVTLAVTRSILNGNIFKNIVLAPIFNFAVQTGSSFSE